ncbi:TolA protein [Fluviicoccus keumensis]|uniref:TolA protein n=1 Tax=Fluviicoccus keumensis TaxID=1435465 RepID=A0A4Q7Z3W1_9GAMM|nr:cell envelope integrity protein TolA [Fluviicoccus keumensis]RZU45072.1 TolA protein [Fluviicoccus keumensis]
MNRDWRTLIRQPLTLSLLLHGGLALSLLVFARHLVPELPPAPSVLKTTLVSRAAVAPQAAPQPASAAPLPEPAQPEPVKPVEPPQKPKAEEKPKPSVPVKKEPPKPAEPVHKERPKTEKPVKEPVLPKGKGEKPEPPKPEKKHPETRPDPKPAPVKEHPKAVEKPKPEDKPAKDKAVPKKTEKAKEPEKPKPPEPTKKPEKTPEKKPEPGKAPEKVPEKDKTKPEKKALEPKKLQPVFDTSEFDKEMQSVQGQLKSQERDRLKKAAEANAKAEADRLAAERAAEEQRLADQKRARELAALVEKYKKQIEDRIYARLNLPPQSTPGQFTEVRIIVIPGGEVINILKLKGSGNEAFDDSVMAAIRKASPLPVPADAQVFNENFRTFSMRIRNKD